MTDLTDHAVAAADIAATGLTWDAMDETQLSTMLHAAMASSVASGAYLIDRCKGDYDRACLEIRRASDLPSKVLMRRYREAERLINADRQPSIPQHAATVAVTMQNISRLSVYLERRRSGPLN